MTNEMIIFWNAVDLMNAGLIGTTGRSITVEDAEGNERVMMEPEAIHTFAKWKELGFSVKKGEHAVARFPIWKGAEKVIKDEEGNETDEKSLRMFRKESCFFSAAQVEPAGDRPVRRSGKGARRAPALPAAIIVDPAAGYGSWLS